MNVIGFVAEHGPDVLGENGLGEQGFANGFIVGQSPPPRLVSRVPHGDVPPILTVFGSELILQTLDDGDPGDEHRGAAHFDEIERHEGICPLGRSQAMLLPVAPPTTAPRRRGGISTRRGQKMPRTRRQGPSQAARTSPRDSVLKRGEISRALASLCPRSNSIPLRRFRFRQRRMACRCTQDRLGVQRP